MIEPEGVPNQDGAVISTITVFASGLRKDKLQYSGIFSFLLLSTKIRIVVANNRLL